MLDGLARLLCNLKVPVVLAAIMVTIWIAARQRALTAQIERGIYLPPAPLTVPSHNAGAGSVR